MTLDLKKTLIFLLIFILFGVAKAGAQTYGGEHYSREVRPAKNLIVMIPDGTSIGVVSAARWYKQYNMVAGANNGLEGLNEEWTSEKSNNKDARNMSSLAIDPYLCGTVRTFSSNAPIGDSAPTTSAYMTGMVQQTGNVAIYPAADTANDLLAVDPAMAYRPLATILEAMRTTQRKATGLVVTVEFPHATPADCSAHHRDRNDYAQIASQMAYQNLDVMFGGGTRYVSDDMRQHFASTATAYYSDDIAAFRAHEQGRVWALWGRGAMPYDIDRDPQSVPSLAEMTDKAIELLSKDEDGFFLMVEGSKVDWAAHDNDAVGCITEFLAFDRAVEVAMDFARRDGNTVVVVMPDHGNGGFSVGRRGMPDYDTASLGELFGTVSQYRCTGRGLAEVLSHVEPQYYSSVVKDYTGLELTGYELAALIEKAIPEFDGEAVAARLTEIMNSRTWFGFTTGGHTGEEVFLAAYHPRGDLPSGLNTNIEMNRYLADAAGLSESLPQVTAEIFAPHTEVFEGLDYSVDRSDPDFPTLTVRDRRCVMELTAGKSVGMIDGRPLDTGSVVVWSDKTGMFYLPRKLAEYFN